MVWAMELGPAGKAACAKGCLLYTSSRHERPVRRGRIDDTGGEGERGEKLYYHLTVLAETTQGYRNLITVEDPVEYQLRGVSQVQVNPKACLLYTSRCV